MTLKTLEDANTEALARAERRRAGVRHNGIACPTCGKELYDSTPNFVMTSSPPQTAVGCVCGFTGARILG